MVDWVHCNGCSEQPGGNRTFVLTNCGHILCDECKNKESENLCVVCKKQCLTVPLSSSMKPEVQMYFTDPADLLTRRLQEVLQVINFQKEHRQRLTARNREKISILNEVRTEFWKLRKHAKELEGENKQLREQLAYLKKILNRSGTPSPTSASSTPAAAHLIFERLGLSTPGSNKTTPGKDVGYSNSQGYSSSSQGHSSSQRLSSTQADVTIAPGRLSVRTPPISGRMGIIPGHHAPPGYPTVFRGSANSPANNIQSIISPMSSQRRSTGLASQTSLNARKTPPSTGMSRSTVLPSLLHHSSGLKKSPLTGLSTYNRQMHSGPRSGYSRNYPASTQSYTSDERR